MWETLLTDETGNGKLISGMLAKILFSLYLSLIHSLSACVGWCVYEKIKGWLEQMESSLERTPCHPHISPLLITGSILIKTAANRVGHVPDMPNEFRAN